MVVMSLVACERLLGRQRRESQAEILRQEQRGLELFQRGLPLVHGWQVQVEKERDQREGLKEKEENEEMKVRHLLEKEGEEHVP